MKRLTLIVFVLVSLASVASTAKVGQPRRFRFDGGLMILGPTQVLRITIASNLVGTTDLFDWVESVYSVGDCSGGVCSYVLVSRSRSGPMRLAPGEAVSIDIPGTAGGVRGEVLSARTEDIRVTFQVIDTSTGAISAFYEGLTLQGSQDVGLIIGQ